MSAEGREQFAGFIPDGDMGQYASALPRLLKEDFTKTMKLLRDKTFQDLLSSYSRKKRTFVIAHENRDVVSSE